MGHPRNAWVEIDLDALAHNVRALRSATPPPARFMAVVKADGYGHGAVEVSRRVLQAGAQRLGVATVAEAIELREAGIEAPLQVLSEPPAEAAALLVRHDIVSTVATREFADALSKTAMRAERPAVCHLKVDSGMNRIGFRAEEAGDAAVWLRDLPGLVFEGIFTHFATADTPGDWEFGRQLERFERAVEDVSAEWVRPPLVHAANSAATILHPETHLDMVRCGIAMYGLHPSPATYGAIDLRPAMSVKARVSQVKRVGIGEGVSYGFTWHAAGPTTIATLPLGYADGVHRVLSNQMPVLIGGRRCRQVGRICMDQLMVEVPDGAVRQGDLAVIVGSQGGDAIGMDELSGLAGTINYELACGFAMRMDRRFS